MRFAIDTQILIWGIRQAASTGQEGRIGEAIAFLEWSAGKGDEIVVPATAVAEFLVGEPPENHAAVLSRIADAFRILPFDVRAVSLAGTLRQDKQFISGLRDQQNTTRVQIKADIEIVAVSKACGVDRIFSNDKQLRSLATRARLAASALPPLETTRPMQQAPLSLHSSDEEE